MNDDICKQLISNKDGTVQKVPISSERNSISLIQIKHAHSHSPTKEKFSIGLDSASTQAHTSGRMHSTFYNPINSKFTTTTMSPKIEITEAQDQKEGEIEAGTKHLRTKESEELTVKAIDPADLSPKGEDSKKRKISSIRIDLSSLTMQQRTTPSQTSSQNSHRKPTQLNPPSKPANPLHSTQHNSKQKHLSNKPSQSAHEPTTNTFLHSAINPTTPSTNTHTNAYTNPDTHADINTDSNMNTNMNTKMNTNMNTMQIPIPSILHYTDNNTHTNMDNKKANANANADANADGNAKINRINIKNNYSNNIKNGKMETQLSNGKVQIPVLELCVKKLSASAARNNAAGAAGGPDGAGGRKSNAKQRKIVRNTKRDFHANISNVKQKESNVRKPVQKKSSKRAILRNEKDGDVNTKKNSQITSGESSVTHNIWGVEGIPDIKDGFSNFEKLVRNSNLVGKNLLEEHDKILNKLCKKRMNHGRRHAVQDVRRSSVDSNAPSPKHKQPKRRLTEINVDSEIAQIAKESKEREDRIRVSDFIFFIF